MRLAHRRSGRWRASGLALSGGAAQRHQPDQAADPPGPQPNRSTPDRGSEIQGRAASAVADARRVSGAGTARLLRVSVGLHGGIRDEGISDCTIAKPDREGLWAEK